LLVRCKYCGEKLNKNDADYIINKNKKIYLHKHHKELYEQLQNNIQEDNFWWNKLYDYIKYEILSYDNQQQLPNYIIIKLKDLRNGVTYNKGEGRKSQYKQGYDYNIILNCFLTCGDKIRWCINNKPFDNERKKFNYIMAIIEGSINDVYISMKNKKIQNDILNRKTVDIDNKNYDIADKIVHDNINNIQKDLHSLTNFLEEDDL
jgi:hypothetical protein